MPSLGEASFCLPLQDEEEEKEEEVPSYPVNLFFTREGYFKKITPLSLRMGGEHKLKEGDAVTQMVESTNSAHLLFFTDKGQVYKSRANDFEDTKASVLVNISPPSWGWMMARIRSIWLLPAISRGPCCSPLKAAGSPRFKCLPMRRKPSVKS